MSATTSFGFRVIGEVIKKDGRRYRVIGDNDNFLSDFDRLLLSILSEINIIDWLKLKYLNDECLLRMLLQEKRLSVCD